MNPLDRIVIYGNPNKPDVGAVVGDVARWCARVAVQLSVARDLPLAGTAGLEGAQWYEPGDQAASPFVAGEHALLICLGGDGTLIHAVRRFWPLPCPVLPVNLGSLGFNASVEPDQVVEAVEAWRAGQASLNPRMLLEVEHTCDGRRLSHGVAVNDVVLAKHSDGRVIHLTLEQGHELISSFSGDGLILATPTGSTAYNLSAGGPILYPLLRAIVATAICPHTLGFRPVVLPPTPQVTMRFMPHHGVDQALLWLDGQETQSVRAGDRITLREAASPLRLLGLPGAQYFSALRRKLCWSGNLPANGVAPPTQEG